MEQSPVADPQNSLTADEASALLAACGERISHPHLRQQLLTASTDLVDQILANHQAPQRPAQFSDRVA